MAHEPETDRLTGRTTTGHEWDGIKELNTPLPRWWLYVFYASIVFSLIYVVLYPAIPGLNGYTRGLLGYDQREQLEASLAQQAAARAHYVDRIAASDLATIQGDPELVTFALAGGATAFADNCVPCHGLGGAGQAGGYPSLADDDWLWGGTLEDIHTTLQVGIRADHPQSRISQMPAYGTLGLLDRGQIGDVAHYVLTLSGDAAEDAEAALRGAETYNVQCAACHGADGAGNRLLGAPALNDRIWLYGETHAAIAAQIYEPRHGVMPAWGRLGENTIKMLTVYVHALGGGE